MAASVNAQIGRDHYQVTINSGRNTVTADEGIDSGGKNEGFSPSELFITSLGACTCITLRMYADRKGIHVDEIKVTLDMERDEEKNITNITRQVTLIGNLTDEERNKLLIIADKCPVHKIMSNPIHINTQLVG